MPDPQPQPAVAPATVPPAPSGPQPTASAGSRGLRRAALRGQAFSDQTLRLRPARSTPRLLSPGRVEHALSWYSRHRALYPRHVVGRIQRAVGATPDEVLGPQTVQHVAAWQAAHGLAVDGIAGPATVTALFGRDIRRDPPEPRRPAPGSGDGGANLSTAEVESALTWYRSHRSLYPPGVVRRIQQAVGAAPDGIIGPKTVRAVGRWQGDHRLSVDGIAGPATLRALFGEDIRPGGGGPSRDDGPLPGLTRPDGYRQIVRVFGEPGTGIVTRSMPAGPGGRVIPVRCHRKVADRFEAALKDLKNDGLAHHIHTYDGCYVYRRKRGGSSWSTHAWGIAMDLNALTNPMTNVRNMRISDSQRVIAPYFERYGFYWGKAFGDPMHFQFCTGY